MVLCHAFYNRKKTVTKNRPTKKRKSENSRERYGSHLQKNYTRGVTNVPQVKKWNQRGRSMKKARRVNNFLVVKKIQIAEDMNKFISRPQKKTSHFKSNRRPIVARYVYPERESPGALPPNQTRMRRGVRIRKMGEKTLWAKGKKTGQGKRAETNPTTAHQKTKLKALNTIQEKKKEKKKKGCKAQKAKNGGKKGRQYTLHCQGGDGGTYQEGGQPKADEKGGKNYTTGHVIHYARHHWEI